MKKQVDLKRFSKWSATRSVTLPLFVAAVFILGSCKKEGQPDPSGNEAATLQKASSGKRNTIRVNPGTSIQAALDAATPGTVIKIKTGIYRESITVNKPNITLTGEGNVIIENPGTADIGIVVDDGGDGFTLTGVT
ncbi:MAG: hypothetical protein EOO14_20310, partial [Chitinophagaceae bacterium]